MSKHVLIYHLYINIFAFREEENEILLTGEREIGREGNDLENKRLKCLLSVSRGPDLSASTQKKVLAFLKFM